VGRLLHDAHDDADTQVECPGGFGCGELPRAVAHMVREFVDAILEVVWLRLKSSLPASCYQQARYVWRWVLYLASMIIEPALYGRMARANALHWLRASYF
jgi:hypothetical protein